MGPEDKPSIELRERTIYIIGPRRLQNKLLAQFLKQETGTACIETEKMDGINLGEPEANLSPDLFLWDCLGMSIDNFLVELKPHQDRIIGHHHLAPFNLNPRLGNEEKALERGVRGFFYEQDGPEQVLKGVRAIFSNELWVSREILTKCILENRGREENPKSETIGLTAREIEILTLIAAGTTNEEIADKLCISPHTVRTHVYNIFKKIDVPNRLQAALWAVQNL